MKKLLSASIIAAALLLLSISTVQAANFEAINTPIIRASPPNDAKIISQGQGDIHTPTGFNNFYNADWALTATENGQVLYVWNIENNSDHSIDPFWIILPFAALAVILPLIFGVFSD